MVSLALSFASSLFFLYCMIAKAVMPTTQRATEIQTAFLEIWAVSVEEFLRSGPFQTGRPDKTEHPGKSLPCVRARPACYRISDTSCRMQFVFTGYGGSAVPPASGKPSFRQEYLYTFFTQEPVSNNAPKYALDPSGEKVLTLLSPNTGKGKLPETPCFL